MFPKSAPLLLAILFCFANLTPLHADYRISGKVSLKGEWQHQIFLATIDKLDDYYTADAELIVNAVSVEKDGSFVLTGDNLPEYSQFYRLYLIKEEHSEFNACLFEGGEEHNFVHLILNNQSKLEVWADTTQYAPFSGYSIVGDIDNVMMKRLSTLVYPSYFFYEIKFPSELKFSRDKFNKDLFEFADTCSSTLVSLAAINTTDYEAYINTNLQQYEAFGNELKTKLKNHPYTKDYQKLLRYYTDDQASATPWLWKLLSLCLGFLCLFMFWQNRQLKTINKQTNESTKSKLNPNLTSQEIKILQLIQQGKSNKEIASDLFIELSTVKSHINKLYAKLQVKNRQEAVQIAKSL